MLGAGPHPGGPHEARLRALCARLTSETGRYVTPVWAEFNDKTDLAKVETTMRDDQTITMTRRQICVQ
jgi:hypothetical protein